MSGAGHNSAKQLRSIIDRILRLKDEQDAIGEDVKEIYAEAKSNGYDKTGLGNAVTLIRKRRKDPAAFAERESITELYLATYDGDGTEVADKERAHTHAPAIPPHDPKTGEITDNEIGAASQAGSALAAAAQPLTASAGQAADTSPAPITRDGFRDDLAIPDYRKAARA